MTDKTIFRVSKNKDNPYVMLDKRPINRADLSWKAKGIWAYLMSKPDDWTVIIEDIINHSTDGAKAVRSGIQELREAGYIHHVQARDGEGQFGRSVWMVFEEPQNDPPPVGVSVYPKRTHGESNTVSTKTAYGKGQTTNNKLTNNRIATLEQTFCSSSGIPIPDNWALRQKRWRTPLKNMYAIAGDATETLLKEAVRVMRKDKLTIAAPHSIENVFTSIYGERQTQEEDMPYA